MPSNAQRWITLSPEEKTVLSSLAAKSKEHVERQWPRSDGLVSVETFDTTNTKNRSVRAFVRGLRLLESLRSPSTWNPRRVSACDEPFRSHADSVEYVIGYHGTSAEAIATIAKDGFDTTLRSGQNQGPGEYFARRYQDAMSFVKQNCNELLVCVVLAGPFTGVADEFCFVCNNPPTCSGVAFTLPVARVRFHQPSVRSRLSVSAQGVRLQFLWRGNAEEWVPYSPVHNAKLNECMTRHYRGDRATRVRLPALRHDNTGGDDYVVDFKKQTQTNLRTSYVREVKWHRVPAMPLRVAVE